jgi:hypothetical protein
MLNGHISFPSNQFINIHRPYFPLHTNSIQFSKYKFIACPLYNILTYANKSTIDLIDSFQSRRYIHTISHGSIIKSVFRTNISDHCLSEMNSYSCMHGRNSFFFPFNSENLQTILLFYCSFTRPIGRCIYGDWRSIKSHHRISNILIKSSFIYKQNISHFRQILTNQRKQSFNTQCFRNRSKTCNI